MSELISISEMNRYDQLLSKVNFGQSIFQDTYFSVEKEYTPHRKLRQVLLEYDQLCHTLISNQLNLQKTNINKEEKEQDLKDFEYQLTDVSLSGSQKNRIYFSIERAKIDLQEIEISIVRSKKLVDDALARKNNFEKLLAELVPQVEALEEQGINFEKAEEMYWTVRFVENAKLDQLAAATGHVFDRENIRSILRLPTSTRNQCLQSIGFNDEAINSMNQLVNELTYDKFLPHLT
jgi:hypothetical protein